MLFRNQLWRSVNCMSQKRGLGLYTILAFGLGLGLSSLLELRGERLIVEKDIGVVKLGVPGPLQVTHARNQLVELLVPDEGDDGCVGSGGVGAVRRVIVLVGAPQVAIGFTGYYNTEDAMSGGTRVMTIESRERVDVLSLSGSDFMPLYGPDPVPTYEESLFIRNTMKITNTTHAAESMRIGLATAMLTVLGRNDSVRERWQLQERARERDTSDESRIVLFDSPPPWPDRD